MTYSWPERLEPYEDERGNRHYPVPSVGPCVGVTTMLNTTLGLSKESLNRWTANTTRTAGLEAAEAAYHSVALLGRFIPPCEFTKAVKGKLGEERADKKKMKLAGDIGTAIHDAAHRFLALELGEAVEPPMPEGPAMLGYQGFVQWWRGSGLTALRMEQTVWHPKWRYAGTVDLFALNPDGELEIWDYKSATGIYDEHHLQVVSYIEAARALGLPVAGGGIVRLPKDPKKSLDVEVVRVGQLYGGSKRHRTHDDLFRVVKAARTIWAVLCEEID